MDHTQRALETFRNPLTCSQAVYAAFKEANADSLARLKAMSGGRAPEGMCGALYAAKLIVPPQHHAAMDAEFSAATGDLACKRIKGDHKTPCEKCVEVAAKLTCKYGKF